MLVFKRVSFMAAASLSNAGGIVMVIHYGVLEIGGIENGDEM